MKIFLQIIAIVLVGYLAQMFLPYWYSFAIVAFIFGYLLKSHLNFLSGFIALVILWGIELYLINTSAAVDLSARVGLIFKLDNPRILIFVTLLIGGLIGGLAALSGAILKPKKKKYATKYR